MPPNGSPVAPLLGLDDTVLELAITANRPDDLHTAVEGALLIIQTHEDFPIASGTDPKTLGVHRLPGQLFQR